MAGPEGGPFFEEECFSSERVKQGYKKRLRVLGKNFYNPEFFSPGKVAMGKGTGFAEVMLAEFAAWVSLPSVKWTIPNALSQLASTKTAARRTISKSTKIKKAALLKKLRDRFPKLDHALQENTKEVKECHVLPADSPGGKNGYYYLEKVEALCVAKWESTDTHSSLGRTRTLKFPGK